MRVIRLAVMLALTLVTAQKDLYCVFDDNVWPAPFMDAFDPYYAVHGWLAAE